MNPEDTFDYRQEARTLWMLVAQLHGAVELDMEIECPVCSYWNPADQHVTMTCHPSAHSLEDWTLAHMSWSGASGGVIANYRARARSSGYFMDVADSCYDIRVLSDFNFDRPDSLLMVTRHKHFILKCFHGGISARACAEVITSQKE